MPTSTTASWSATRACACRCAAIANIVGVPDLREPRHRPGRRLGTGFTLAERRLVSNAVLAQLRRARRRRRRHGAGHARLPGGLRPRPRRADLHRRARRQLPERGAEERRSRKLFAGVDDEHRHPALRELPVRRRPRRRRLGVLEVHRAATRDAGAIALHLAGAAGDPGGFNGPTFALDRQHRRRCCAKIQATDATYTETALSFMTPPRPDDLSALQEPRRQDASSITAPAIRSSPATTASPGLRGAARGQRRRRRRTSPASTWCRA